jgi:hypothetical protein
MHEVAITRKGTRRTYFLPASWHEVSEQDWPTVSLLFLLGDTALVRMKVLRGLLRTKRGTLISESSLRTLDAWQLREIASLLSWMLKDRMESRPFEYIIIQGERYFLPNDGLKNITLIEYAFLDLYYMVYVDAVEAGQHELAEQHLNRLLAYMCRPMRQGIDPDRPDPDTWDGDIREKFNNSICDRRIDKMQDITSAEKLAILMFFTGCKAAIHRSYAGTVFPQQEDEKGNKVHTGATAMEPTAWLDMCFALAGGIFGTLEQTMYTNLFTVLRHLQLQELQSLNKKKRK